MHTGFPLMGYPSAGAWVTYGLGTENRDLPGFVVLQSGGSSVPHGGVGLFSNGFLPAPAPGVDPRRRTHGEPIRNIRPREPEPSQRRRLDFVQPVRPPLPRRGATTPQVEAAIRNYETAYRMQSAVPELCDLSRRDRRRPASSTASTPPTPNKAAYARQCLLARRLVERGVRFVELTLPDVQHRRRQRAQPLGPARRPRRTATRDGPPGRPADRRPDQRPARRRGLLDETLIVWAGEFGRTPFSQGSNGRDHNPFGFSVLLAGGGVKGGTIYGATDDFGYYAVENACDVYDLWATVLHLLGINHEDLTYRYGGRDFRLTDVHGHVLKDILAVICFRKTTRPNPTERKTN